MRSPEGVATPLREPEVTVDVAHAGPPLDRWMYVIVRIDGLAVWTCPHRHHTWEPVRRCANRALRMKMLDRTVRRLKDQWMQSRPLHEKRENLMCDSSQPANGADSAPIHPSHVFIVDGWSAGPKWFEQTHCQRCQLAIEDERMLDECHEFYGGDA